MSRQHISVVLTLLLMGVGCTGGGDGNLLDENRPGAGSGRKQMDPASRKGRGQGRGLRAAGEGRIPGGGGLSARELEPISLTRDELDAIQIETIQASRRSLMADLSALGKVVAPPRTQAIVSYAFPARISDVHVRLGDWVQKGDEVVTLQSEEVGEAKSEFYKAIADFELARKNYARQERLHDRGVGAEKDYLSAEAEYTVAGASREAAEKKLHILGFTEEQVAEITESHQVNPTIVLYAPIGGKIVKANAVLGAMVDQATEILTIMNPNLLRVDAEIYEKDIAKIRVGQEVDVRVEAYPSEVFQGRIQYVSDIFKEDTRTTTVYTEVANTDYKLKPGMFANITIHLNHHDSVLALPQTAVLDDRDLELVFVEQDGQFIPHIVETGIRENEYVQILSGIQEGDVVVTNGNFQLKSKMYEDILEKGHVH
jgi:cobalt-zinc-cadmium efflux system membrane fusion protein